MLENTASGSSQAENEAYIAKIRKTIAESSELVLKAELRIAETDRFLSEHGLTREELLNYRFTPEQRLAVNAELMRRGLPPIDDDSDDVDSAERQESLGRPVTPNFEAGDVQTDLQERHRKFGLMMKPFQI